MKINALVLTLIAMSSPAMAAPGQLQESCETAIRTAVAALKEGYIHAETDGSVTLDKSELASVEIADIQVTSSSCVGPAECDDQHPDSFVYKVKIGKKGEGLTGKITASYHRGNCSISKISLKQ